MNFKKISLVLFLLIIVGVVGVLGYARTSRAQSIPDEKTLKAYGLSSETIKYLSPEELQRILKSKTPGETAFEDKNSTSSRPFGTPPSPLTANPNDLIGIQKNTVNCYDYYNFGSIQTDLTTQSSTFIPGSTVTFNGTVSNKNAYPIVDGTLYVKIFKEKGVKKDSNGPDVVDEFIAVDNINIDANSSVKVSFPWQVSSFARGGDYRIASFFMTDKKFNLLGLSFTDDVVGNTFDFTIKNKDVSVYFDKSSVSINDQGYLFASFPPSIEEAKSADIKASVVNTTSTVQPLNITWKLYQWDAIAPANLIRTTYTSTTVKPNSSAKVNITVPDRDFPVYLLIGELTYKDTKSIINIRYTRAKVDKIRLNFPAVTHYPLMKGDTVTMFTCLHNSGSSPIVQNAKLLLELKDTNGTVIDSYTYTGGVTGAMMGLKKDIVPSKTLSNFTLHAQLWQNDQLVDESNLVYDCNLINPAKCSSENKNGSSSPSQKLIIGIILAIVLLVIIAIIFIHKNKMNKKLVRSLFIALVLPASLLFKPHLTEAKSISWHDVQYDFLVNFANRTWGTGRTWWYPALLGSVSTLSSVTVEGGQALSSWWGSGARDVTVNYNTEIRNTITNALISDGDAVPINTLITLKFIPHIYTDIVWFGTGYAGDSPYGEWRANAAPPAITHLNLPGNPDILDPTACDVKDKISEYYDSWLQTWWTIYIPLVIAPPVKTITNTTGLMCGSLTGDETNGFTQQCTVSNTGPISPSFNFASTFGKFYYRYRDYRTENGAGVTEGPGCYGNNVALETTVGDPFYFRPSWGSISLLGENMYEAHISQPYSMPIAAQSITYNLVGTPAVPQNQPPAAPIITGPTTGLINTNYTYNFVSTDPENDTIKYGIDWSEPADGVVDAWLPASGYVASGVSQSSLKQWAGAGSHSFKAQAIDSKGAASVWSSYSTTLTAAANTVANPTISGPTTGYINTVYGYTLSDTDPEGDQIRYQLDSNMDGNPDTYFPSATTYVNSGVTQTYNVSWPGRTARNFQVRVFDAKGLTSGWVPYTVNIVNRAPTPPTISAYGAHDYLVGSSQSFVFQDSTDPDGDTLSYRVIDWGDGSPVQAGPFQAYPSNYIVGHTWSSPGTYIISTRARDSWPFGYLESTVSTAPITITTTPPVSGQPLNARCQLQAYLLVGYSASSHTITPSDLIISSSNGNSSYTATPYTSKTPSFTLPSPGTYPIYVNITDGSSPSRNATGVYCGDAVLSGSPTGGTPGIRMWVPISSGSDDKTMSSTKVKLGSTATLKWEFIGAATSSFSSCIGTLDGSPLVNDPDPAGFQDSIRNAGRPPYIVRTGLISQKKTYNYAMKCTYSGQQMDALVYTANGIPTSNNKLQIIVGNSKVIEK